VGAGPKDNRRLLLGGFIQKRGGAAECKQDMNEARGEVGEGRASNVNVGWGGCGWRSGGDSFNNSGNGRY